jgi:nitrite reductase (NO-forming)
MKRIKLLSLSIAATLFMSAFMACGSSDQSTEESAEDQNTDNTEVATDTPATAATADFSAGQEIFKAKCMVCHMENGEGVSGTFPPLAKSDYLLADKKRAILQTLQGAKSPIIVNGTEYTGGVMTIVELEEQQTADVVNYILNSWGNAGGTVTIDDVKAVKAENGM